MFDLVKNIFSPAEPEYEFHRSGSFRVNSFCWTAEERDLTFKVHIKSAQLDREGFVVDNVMVENYFKDRFGGKTIEASCETIATLALEDFCSKVPYASYIQVSISGSPDVTWLVAEAPTRRHVRDICARAKRKARAGELGLVARA